MNLVGARMIRCSVYVPSMCLIYYRYGLTGLSNNPVPCLGTTGGLWEMCMCPLGYLVSLPVPADQTWH